jgi:uncharacterized phiE125 gp8 family phage protein
VADRYVLTKVSTKLPLSPEVVRAHLKSPKGEDDVVALFTRAAVQHCESYTGVDFRANTWTLIADCFPTSNRFLLKKSPVASVTSVKYLKFDGAVDVLTTVPAVDYFLKQGASWSEILLHSSAPAGSPAAGVWPTDVSLHQPEANVEVEFLTGVPAFIEEVRVGVLHLIAAMWANRGDALESLSSVGGVALAADLAKQSGANTLLDGFKIQRV